MFEGAAASLPLSGVHPVAGHRAYIQMVLFPGTPELESRNCPRLESQDFGNSYLPTTEFDQDKVRSKVIALIESFPTPCHTLESDIKKRSILDF
jgi:hypothetical protein